VSDGLLRENTTLLLRRERELHALRLRYSRALGWLSAVEAMSARTRGAEQLAEEWPRIIVAHVKVQSAALWRVSQGGDGLRLVAYAGGTPPATTSVTGQAGLGALLDAEPDGIDNGDEPGELGAQLGLRRFLWNTLHPVADARYLAAVGFNAATWQFHPAFDAEDLSFARMAARMLEAMLGQLESIGELTTERELLRLLNEELTSRDRQLHEMHEELMDSSRLAAVGELAGLTAHEVLNPITSIQGRVTRMLGAQDETFAHNQRALAAIHGAWAASLARGGLPALFADLSAPSPIGETLAAEDVAVLGELAAYFGGMLASSREDLGFLVREVRRVTHIVDGMRGLSRRRGSPRPTSLVGLISESFDVVADGFQRRQITTSLDCASDPRVEVDRYECIQVLTNLLRNAVPAIDERGAGAGSVRVRVERAADRALVHVEDDGNGIRPEHVPHLFELRFSTRSDGAGTGLGLCIARRLVRGWGGDLRLEWTLPGEGTSFLVELPLAATGAG